MLDIRLDLLQTLALAAVVYFIGIQLKRHIGWEDRLNIPAAVVGGLLFTFLAMIPWLFPGIGGVLFIASGWMLARATPASAPAGS